jgi:hypothetical protein
MDIRDRRQQVSAFVRYNKRDVCIWKIPAQRSNRWRRQNQIADSLELQEKNFH